MKMQHVYIQAQTCLDQPIHLLPEKQEIHFSWFSKHIPNTDKCIVAAVVIDNENTVWLHKKDAQCNSLNLLAQPEAWEPSC